MKDGVVISFGQYQLENDNTWFEGFGCLFTIETDENEGKSNFVSYNELLVPWAKSNKMNIGLTHLLDDNKKIYNKLRSSEKAILTMTRENTKWTIKQTVNALTGEDNKYITEIGVFETKV